LVSAGMARVRMVRVPVGSEKGGSVVSVIDL
jgi:hypothetical protein